MRAIALLRLPNYPGGQREMTPARLQAKPNGDDRLLRKVVKGMLPINFVGIDNDYIITAIYVRSKVWFILSSQQFRNFCAQNRMVMTDC